MHSDVIESARLDAGITPELLDLIRRAAEVQRCSVSDYVATTLQEAARRDVGEVEVIRLSREASEQVAAALIDPPPINDALRNALIRHRRMVRQE